MSLSTIRKYDKQQWHTPGRARWPTRSRAATSLAASTSTPLTGVVLKPSTRRPAEIIASMAAGTGKDIDRAVADARAAFRAAAGRG